jgi:predicted Zn-dependent protease
MGDLFEVATEGMAAVVLPPSEEVELGRQLAAEVERQATLHPDASVQSYVAGVGEKVSSHADDTAKEITYSFKVIKDDATVNAFALPGGYIYVYSGLLLEADNEAELAAVLAHETAHVSERHAAERVATAYGIERVAAVVTGEDPSMASEIVTGFLGQGALLTYGREQESEADAVGLDLQIEAGYDPRAFVTFFRKLGSGSRVPTLLSSHPHPEDRINAIQREIDRRGDVPDFRGTQRHQEIQSRL